MSESQCTTNSMCKNRMNKVLAEAERIRNERMSSMIKNMEDYKIRIKEQHKK